MYKPHKGPQYIGILQNIIPQNFLTENVTENAIKRCGRINYVDVNGDVVNGGKLVTSCDFLTGVRYSKTNSVYHLLHNLNLYYYHWIFIVFISIIITSMISIITIIIIIVIVIIITIIIIIIIIIIKIIFIVILWPLMTMLKISKMIIWKW